MTTAEQAAAPKTPGKIVSHLLPQDGTKYFAFSTVVGDKPLTTAILLGREGANGLECSEIGQRAAAIALGHAPQAASILAVVVTKRGKQAQRHVEQCLRFAPAGAVVLIHCLDSKIYDDASPGLHITMKGVDIGSPKFRALVRKNEAQLRAQMLSGEELAAVLKKAADEWPDRMDRWRPPSTGGSHR